LWLKKFFLTKLSESRKLPEVKTKSEIPLTARCIAILEQGIKLINELDDELYTTSEAEGRACVGSHFRHNLDFVLNFLRGLPAGRIDYNRRERDLRVEEDREYAVSRFDFAVAELGRLTSDIDKMKIQVRLEESPEDTGIGEQWCDSSVLRELEFLHSHTLHHYALIADKLSLLGYKVSKEFGVAPSTLQYWAENERKHGSLTMEHGSLTKSN
jgi:hypothetical protein